jgi:hypothetical protein
VIGIQRAFMEELRSATYAADEGRTNEAVAELEPGLRAALHRLDAARLGRLRDPLLPRRAAER